MRIIAVLLCFVSSAAAANGQLPRLKATTLSGRDITLPGDPKIAVYVIAFGFSRNCDKAVGAWDKRIAPVYGNNPRVAYYEMPELQGVPGFVKPFIVHGMRKSVPKPEQERFAPIYEGDAAIKQIVGYKDPDAAYIVVATSGGKVVWTSHAAASDASFAELQKAVAEYLK